MAITLNLTAVLITAIICLTLCFVCKCGKDEKKPDKKQQSQKNNVIEIPQFVGQRKSDQERHLMEYMEDQARRRGDIEP